MKKAIFIIATVVLLTLLFFFLRNSLSSMIERDFTGNLHGAPSITVTPYPTVLPGRDIPESVFVPYWTLNSQLSQEDNRLIYFGITPTREGIDRSEAGFKNLSTFNQSAFIVEEKLLALRMLNQNINFDILESTGSQQAVISGTIDTATQYGFDGIVLDLELKALPFDSVVKQINEFVTRFYADAKRSNLTFSVLVYGDTFYRVRPFDVKYIAKNSDEIMVMAYDFHKSGGDPGPNFPLGGEATYGYDYLELMDDFLAVVPAEKLTVVFGLFGYDWPVDEKNISIDAAEPLSYFQIKSRYIDACPGVECILKRDDMSSETNITYTDTDGQRHSVWFEDMESVMKKKQLLKTRGINSFSYWAYSYY